MRWIVAGILSLPTAALALQCAVDPLAQYTELGGDPTQRKVNIEADTSSGNYDQVQFAGDVALRQGDKHLFAPKLDYDGATSMVFTEDKTTFGSPEAAMIGTSAQYDLTNEVITVDQAQYYLRGSAINSLGEAKEVRINRATNINEFDEVSWTTCERTDPMWSLKANSLTIDKNINRATAWHSTLQIKGTPIFYLPYFSFPTDDQRATGLLAPSLNTSEDRGIELQIPFYWNIAPNQDATFTLRPMTKRGVMLDAEYRFLTERQQGKLYGSYLPNDRDADGENRWAIKGNYQYRFNPDWVLNAQYQDVSDLEYIHHFDNDLSIYDDWYLERYARVDGRTDWGRWMWRSQDYERVSNRVSASSIPYSRLPQITYTNSWRDDNWRYTLDAELVRFYKDKLGGAWRGTIDGSVAYRWDAIYGYLEPKLSLNARHYNFSGRHDSLHDEKATSFVLPTFSLDGKLIFERNLSLFGEGWVQTLEPRLFYLYTPYQDQSEVPNFDSANRSLSWGWLFARNRFTGGDRIGDNHQLTTALTTRFLSDEDGQEKLRLSVGQVQYFRDRRVPLTGNNLDDRGRSDLVSEGVYQIDRHWRLRGQSFWNIDKHSNQRSVLDLSYNLDADRFFGLSHRYKRDDYDQISLYGVWRFDPQWRAFLRQDYSLRHDQSFNTLLGIEYNDCCWAWRLLGQRYRDEPDSKEARNALYLEFVLKGLGNMGNRSGALLRDEINGFRPLAEERSF
ncbi:LPS assembly protein LptD [Suttonella sp. R2A3]|uniref:LPS-assembly protein LptD n=1 Tax=Suttonella sp. R2A3 TaxID=2908648 RepID=UPI001F2155AB|nr:LPS assembly protein LptD [Suttonella sp. R2A3]UJF25391.1 LPS assembly protein LptD [Suttonella sp. R2A3]